MDRARILVADDDPLVRATIDHVLGAEHELVLVDGVDTALEILRHGPTYDLVLCDLAIPKIGGPALYREIETLRPATARRFVFMQGGSSEAERVELRRIDRPVLRKPFTIDELRFVVDGMLELGDEARS